MDVLPNIDTFSVWLTEYGSLTLFILLTLGIIALPVPEETMMIAAGILMHQERLDIFPTIIMAYAGAICGITVSYTLGKTAGRFLVQKYGGWIGLTEKRSQQVHNWFEKFGKWTLMIGYFIPGVRHFTGIFAGISGFSYNHFSLYAYTGAIIWVSLFLSIGYFFGNQWIHLYEMLEVDLELIIIVIAALLSLGYLYKYLVHNKKKQN